MSNIGQGSLSFSQKNAPSVPPFPAGAADNGLSVDPITGNIVWGDPFGATGPANLLSSREIDFNGWEMFWTMRNSGIGDDYQIRFRENFIGIVSDLATQRRGMSLSVDFPGNTGMAIANDAAEASYQPPFYRVQDSTSGAGGKLQWNDPFQSLELTDIGNSNGLSIFPPGGNVAVQQTGLADPGVKFFVDGGGFNVPLMQARNFSSTFFNIDPVAEIFQMGDVGGVTGSNFFQINNLNGLITIQKVADRFLNIDTTNQIYSFGDIDSSNNGMFINIDDNGRTIQIGEVNGNLNNTRFSINDSTGIGDLSSIVPAVYSINGNPGVSGTFAPPLSITVEGGIITAIS